MLWNIYKKIYIKNLEIYGLHGLYGCELYGHKTPMWEPEDINYNMPGSSPCMATLKDNRENWKKNDLLLVLICNVFMIMISAYMCVYE